MVNVRVSILKFKMSLDLRFICQSLLSNRSNLIEYDSIIEQFISSLNIDSITLSNLANDSNFPTLIQCLMLSVTRVPVPSQSEGKAPKRVLNILQFLTQIAHLSPDIARIISANISADTVFANFFKKSTEDNSRKVDATRHLPFLKFICVLASEADMLVASTESVGYLYSVAVDLFNSAEVAKWAIATVAALVKNTPVAASFIRSTHNFGKLKTTLASLLSSEDPAVVISSLALLVLLFPASITPNTSVKAAINAIAPLEGFPPAIHLISWIIFELNESAPLNAESIWTLIQVAMKGDNRAFTIYNLLIDLSEQHHIILDVMQSMNCLFALINSLLDTEDGFVAISGCTFLYTVFQDSNDYVFSEDVVDPFTKSLRLVLAMRKFSQSERREAAVLLLRFMVRARESITYVIKILEENEQSLFLDFQRQIEQNNSFLSVVYFLFLYEASHFLRHWRQKLISLIIDSQFPALLVHVITESRNRMAISDSLRVSQILSNGMKNDVIYEPSPMFDSLVSGYLLINHKRSEAVRKERSNHFQAEDEMYYKINELEVQRDCIEKEISTYKESLDQSSAIIQDEQNQRKVIDEENSQLKKSLSSIRTKNRKLNDQVKDLENLNIALSQQVEVLKKNSACSSVRESDVRSKIISIAQMENNLKKSEETISKLENQIKQLREKGEKDRKQVELYKQKLSKIKKGKKVQLQNNNRLIDNIQEIEEAKVHLEKQVEEYEKENKLLKDQNAEHEKTEAELKKEIMHLQYEIDHMHKNNEEIFNKAEIKMQSVDDLQDRISKLEDRNREFKMLVKLIHKTTNPNKALPQTVVSFMKSS